jgi:hypothetical protein
MEMSRTSQPRSAWRRLTPRPATGSSTWAKIRHLRSSKDGPIFDLPFSDLPVDDTDSFDFRQDIVYDTRFIREELGYSEIIPYHCCPN